MLFELQKNLEVPRNSLKIPSRGGCLLHIYSIGEGYSYLVAPISGCAHNVISHQGVLDSGVVFQKTKRAELISAHLIDDFEARIRE